MRAMLPNLAFLLFSGPLWDHPLGEQYAANVTGSQRLMHGTKDDIKA